MRPPGRISDGHEVERAMPRILHDQHLLRSRVCQRVPSSK